MTVGNTTVTVSDRAGGALTLAAHRRRGCDGLALGLALQRGAGPSPVQVVDGMRYAVGDTITERLA